MPAQPANPENELYLLETLENTPETTQADLAAQVGVAVGTVNWYLKRWSKKGYVKVSRIGRWRWSYLLTPQGISHKATLATKYVDASMILYRRTRNEAKRLLAEAQSTGFEQVIVAGDDELADICRLTCVEMGMKIETDHTLASELPVVRADGACLVVTFPGSGLEDDNRP